MMMSMIMSHDDDYGGDGSVLINDDADSWLRGFVDDAKK